MCLLVLSQRLILLGVVCLNFISFSKQLREKCNENIVFINNIAKLLLSQSDDNTVQVVLISFVINTSLIIHILIQKINLNDLG